MSPIKKIAWKLIKVWIRNRFPAVEHISTAALAKRIAQADNLVLIDARKLAEYTTSHLPGALRADSVEAVEQIVSSQKPTIVVYCSIGYRSARLAQQLTTAGYTAVNLEGSLFQWANENRSLSSGERSTRQVHPFNSQWGWLLDDSKVWKATPKNESIEENH